jgi:uncharacterized short protein YbdD (DUF466 family)
MSSFERIVTRETVLSFDVKPSEWDEEDQAQLHEAMTLAWKENPDWTDEEAKQACEEQVESILYQNFRRTYGQMLKHATEMWHTAPDAYDDYVKLGRKKFEDALNEQLEFEEFSQEFYERLREMWNICSVGMWDAFKDMKKKDWSFDDYDRYIEKERKKMGYESE